MGTQINATDWLRLFLLWGVAAGCEPSTKESTDLSTNDYQADALAVGDGRSTEVSLADERGRGDEEAGPDLAGGIDLCAPVCDGRECGPDGCGGTCGSCQGNQLCVDGSCGCVPDCQGRECGSDGCGGTCGTCGAGPCDDQSGHCLGDRPNCNGKECGSDGLGGLCGVCPEGLTCTDSGRCMDPLSVPDCSQTVACVNRCEAGNTSCPMVCVEQSGATTQMQFQALLNCLQGSGYWDCADEDTSCRELAQEQCLTEIEACFSFNYKCESLFYCNKGCPQQAGVPQCGIDCTGTASPETVALYNDLVQCLANACPDWSELTCQTEALSGVCSSQRDLCMPPADSIR